MRTELDSLLNKSSDSSPLVKYCAGFCGFGIIVLNLAALIAACVDIDVDCNDNLNMHASYTLIVGSILTAICAVIDCCFGTQNKDNNNCLAVFNICYLFIIFILSCYGFTVYNEMDEDCKTTLLGEVLLAWSLIYFLIDAGLCCCGCCLFIGNALG